MAVNIPEPERHSFDFGNPIVRHSTGNQPSTSSTPKHETQPFPGAWNFAALSKAVEHEHEKTEVEKPPTSVLSPPRHIMTLPPELRLRIYELIFEDVLNSVSDVSNPNIGGDGTAWRAIKRQHLRTVIALAHTNRLVRKESVGPCEKQTRDLIEIMDAECTRLRNLPDYFVNAPVLEEHCAATERLNLLYDIDELLSIAQDHVMFYERVTHLENNWWSLGYSRAEFESSRAWYLSLARKRLSRRRR